jgi:AraC family transcriptional regulator of adaptative response / DNA-3-methyladenine glycosylase II
MLEFFAVRAVPGVEEVAGGRYRRSVRLAHGPAVVADGALEAGDPRDADEAARLWRALIDADADTERIDATLGSDPLLRALVAAAPGIRVPGCVDPGEIAIRAVLGQQVSVAAARTQAARLVERCGEPLEAPVGLDPETLPMPRARGRALVTLAAAMADGLDPRDRDALLALPGIGPWTADYVAMRCGDPDVLLETDLGVRRALRALGGPDDLPRHAERWRPWRSYAVQHLWSRA